MVEKAVRFLIRAPQATVPEAMRVIRFSEEDITDPNIRKQILRRLPGRKKPTASSVVAAPMSSVACSPITTVESDLTNNEDLKCPPPKRVRIRKTAPAAMKDQMTTATTTMTKATTMTTMKTPTEITARTRGKRRPHFLTQQPTCGRMHSWQ
jgi:hypothetical protein